MKLLSGVSTPAGEGIVLEVHLDIQSADQLLVSWLESVGFENDPFLTFYPANYTQHMTGRARVLPKHLAVIVPKIRELVKEVIRVGQTYGAKFYVEVELVRGNHRLAGRESSGVDVVFPPQLTFHHTGQHGHAKADVHVKFHLGTVNSEIRAYLVSKKFYWVSIPGNARSPAKEVATLQTTTFAGARKVYDLLSTNPLPGCIGVQLEQKLLMEATSPSIPMPEIIEVT